MTRQELHSLLEEARLIGARQARPRSSTDHITEVAPGLRWRQLLERAGRLTVAEPKTGFAADNERRRERTFSLGVFTWLAIVEQEADKLTEGGRNALGLLREDLEKLAGSDV